MRIRLPAVVLLISLSVYASSGQAAAQMRLPFSQAVRVGDILYLSGQIGAVPGENRPVVGGLVPETHQAMDNIGTVLRNYGLGFPDVFRCTVMLTDMEQWSEFNQVYVSYFNSESLPARSAIGVTSLALGAQTEIECMARFTSVERTPHPVTTQASSALGPYSTAVVAGDLVFISGAIPFDPATGTFAPTDFPSQIRQALANFDTALGTVGVDRSDVVKTTVFLRNAEDMPAMNEAYAAYFGSSRPARTTVPGVDWGRTDLLVEIEGVALARRLGEEE